MGTWFEKRTGRVVCMGPALLLAGWLGLAASVSGQEAREREPRVHISYPLNEMLIRANVPVFGTAFVPGDEEGLKEWVLEYGPGRDPQDWSRIQSGQEPITTDPYLEGTVNWNPDVEPVGNLANWATGLASYTYGRWHENLNGIYTLRLRAESTGGRTAEVRRYFYVGEAVARTRGGTGISADRQCRLVVSPFSYGGMLTRVVAIVRQTPPPDFPVFEGAGGTDESGERSQSIYETVDERYELASPIYRIYPNGMETDPAAILEMDWEGGETRSAMSHAAFATPEERPMLFQYNMVAQVWVPLETRWADSTAMAALPQVVPYEAYVALMRRRTVSEPELQWHRQSALSGRWRGRTEPHAQIKVRQGERMLARGRADEDGVLDLPALLNPGTGMYDFSVTPLGGDPETDALSFRRNEQAGALLDGGQVTLRVAGSNQVTSQSVPVVYAEAPQLSAGNVSDARSLQAHLRPASGGRGVFIEMVEVVPGSGRFLANLSDVETQEGEAWSPAVWMRRFPHGTEFSLEASGTAVRLVLKDEIPPAIHLASRTHPSLVYAHARNAELRSSRSHSQSRVDRQGDVWVVRGRTGRGGDIGIDRVRRTVGADGYGMEGKADVFRGDGLSSARVTYWPVESFSTRSWPMMGFTYRLVEPSPWQLMLRRGSDLRAFTFGLEQSWFRPYAGSQRLIADGEWHFWQQNLEEGEFREVDSVAFGSWLLTGHGRADPAFHHPHRNAIQIRDVWVGRTYSEPHVEMSWRIEDQSPLRQLKWWVDQDAVSDPETARERGVEVHEVRPPEKEGTCEFRVAAAGRWFFHLLAEDSAGNVAGPVSYPLFILASRSAPLIVSEPISNDPIPVRWEIPGDGFQVRIPGYGDLLDANQFALEVFGKRYPLKRGAWDRGRELLTIRPEYFDGYVPMVFDGEVVMGRVRGEDIQGRAVDQLPMVEMHVASMFRQDRFPGSRRVTVASANGSDKIWGLFWGRPNPPWLRYFPTTTNNVLRAAEFDWAIVDRPSFVRTAEEEDLIWERVIRESEASEPLLKLCHWDRASVEQAGVRDVLQRHLVDASGERFDLPGRAEPTSHSRDSWVMARQALDPFERGRLFTVRRSDRGRLEFRAGRRSELEEWMQNHPDDMWRVEAYLPPGEGSFRVSPLEGWSLKVATDRRQSPAREVDDEEWSIEAGEEWVRVVVLFEPLRDARRKRIPRIRGEFYW